MIEVGVAVCLILACATGMILCYLVMVMVESVASLRRENKEISEEVIRLRLENEKVNNKVEDAETMADDALAHKLYDDIMTHLESGLPGAYMLVEQAFANLRKRIEDKMKADKVDKNAEAQ